MDRARMLDRLGSEDFEVIVVGGGATGLGCAVDAASRGYRTALLEGDDFAKGTSSRSTKLVHGGVRYLQQGNISLVLEALKWEESDRSSKKFLMSMVDDLDHLYKAGNEGKILNQVWKQSMQRI